MLNQVMDDARHIEVAVTNPTSPVAGAPCRLGFLTAVAVQAEGVGNVSAATNTVVDLGPSIYRIAVTDTVGGGIAVGATLFYQDGAGNNPGTVDNLSTGFFFGFALEAVGAGLTATIQVLKVPSPAAGALGAGTVGTNQLANGAATADKVADAILTGLKAAVVTNANVVGGIPVVHRIDVADAATGDVDTVLTHKTRIVDAWAVKTGALGGAANTVQLFNGAAALTDAMSINIADQAIARAASIDDAQHEIAAGGTLKITRTKAGGNAACTVYVLGVRVA